MQIIIRFLVGGLVVSAFALIGDIMKPKSFAGLFGAAPSVAVASLGLALLEKPTSYTAVECRSMLLGAFGLLAYCLSVGVLLKRFRFKALSSSLYALPAWFAVAFLLWGFFAKS